MKTIIRVSGAVLLATGLMACGDDEEKPDAGSGDAGVADTGIPADGGVDGGVEDTGGQDGGGTFNPACTMAIRAREAEVMGQLPAPYADPSAMVGPANGNQALEADFAGKYRDDLANHVGCAPRATYGANVEFLVTDNTATVPSGAGADIDGYDCAAKAYSTANVDTGKPIVILVHGNSSSVTTWEEYASDTAAGTPRQTLSGFSFTVESTAREMLATKLLAAGYEVLAFDARVDKVNELDDFNGDSMTGNASRNIDHGWAVPMLQQMVKAVMTNNPGRKVSLIGHSLGVTVIRDALRRLYIEWEDGAAGAVNPFEHTKDIILASGANHGVANYVLCDAFPTQMRGTVVCEMGDRSSFSPTYFSAANNGPSDLYATPCADGSYAFGKEDQCGGNMVQYTTITMEDLPDGALQDEFVSEDAARINLEGCVDNELIGLSDYDASGYFITGFYGFIANHFGSIRSDAGMQVILDKLAD